MFFVPHHFPGLERCLFEVRIELVLAHYASLPQPTRYPVQNNQTQLLLHLNPGDKRHFDAIRSRRGGGEEEEVGGKKPDLYTIDQFPCAQREDAFHCNQTR